MSDRDGVMHLRWQADSERMRQDEDFAGLQQVVDVLRKNMCIIPRNIVLLSAHISFEGRR